jgi:hypothetical protein
MIEQAPQAPLSLVIRDEIVPSPDALWQRLSGHERIPRLEGSSQPVTSEEFLVAIVNYLQHMVNSQFEHMNYTYTRLAEQFSVCNHFHAQAGQYMMEEMMRLVKCVEELQTLEIPGELMEICIEQVPTIQPALDYVKGQLDDISRYQWSLAAAQPKRSSRRDGCWK